MKTKMKMDNRIHLRSLFLLTLIAGLLVFGQTIGQTVNSDKLGRTIVLPDIPGYKTMKCDFHMHTVLSDGSVWPDIRVEEALRDGLDAISITDHLEYQPHKNDIPHPDRNRSYQLALQKAKNQNLIVINGAEFTRGMPPGHLNAIFLDDANKLLTDDVMEGFREAIKQDAFVFWNHPHWTSQKQDGMAELTDMHQKLIKDGLINGIEIVNSKTYSDEAFQIAIDNNLTILGTSDIHGLIEWQYKLSEGEHRPLTLIFAEEKTEEAIKEGLVNRRTAVYFDNTLVGKSEFLVPLIQNSLNIKKAEYRGRSTVLSAYVENLSDVDFILENQSDFTLHSHAGIITINAHSTTLIQIKTLERLPNFNLQLKVLNAFVAPKEHPEIILEIL
ncbi:MAG: Sb-PDE family phosphodiesterase [Bacteroidota bacterium]|nr:Sb-PDE family phosphodiesterase [Bacteroidota bacterium]